MSEHPNSPSLTDLYQLRAQLEADESTPLATLRERDHRLGSQCHSSDDVSRLLCWLYQRQGAAVGVPQEHPLRSRAAIVLALRLLSMVMGAASMAGFLLASGKGLVNVFVFLLFFVLLQLLFCAISTWVLLRSVSGSPPAVLPLNPARFMVSRSFPDQRFYRECASVLRLLVLRYGQELGALFTFGALLAFLVVLAFSEFTFVWGSTFSVSNAFVESMASVLAAPWSAWLQVGVVSAQTVADSRYSAAVTDLSMADIDSMRAWWPFLLMCLLFYALLPRLILWLGSRFCYRRSIRQSFLATPGAERVLARMKAPIVTTQSSEVEVVRGGGNAEVASDSSLILVDWAAALDVMGGESFEDLQSVPVQNVFIAGLGSLREDAELAAVIDQQQPEKLMVVVKAWEPPMADLADFLNSLARIERCSLLLMPLPGKRVGDTQLDTWRDFARGLSAAVVEVSALHRPVEEGDSIE